ncbi:MAG: DUF1993 family protein [bacterium]
MTSLYDISVGSYKSAVSSAVDVMRAGQTYFADHPEEKANIVQMKLAPDMLPFPFQVWSIIHHSLGATKGLIAGQFTIPDPVPETDFDGYLKLLEDTRAELENFSEDELNAATGKAVIFSFGELSIPFTADKFALDFSLPNLYFHLTTLYDMLRIKGVPLGKKVYLGNMRVGLPEQ